jgi:hypothetical protein
MWVPKSVEIVVVIRGYGPLTQHADDEHKNDIYGQGNVSIASIEEEGGG